MRGLEYKAKEVVIKTELTLAGAFLLCVGLAFLTASFLIAFGPVLGWAKAFLCVGCAYVGVGFLCFLISKIAVRRLERERLIYASRPDPWMPLIEAVIRGFHAGRRPPRG